MQGYHHWLCYNLLSDYIPGISIIVGFSPCTCVQVIAQVVAVYHLERVMFALSSACWLCLSIDYRCYIDYYWYWVCVCCIHCRWRQNPEKLTHQIMDYLTVITVVRCGKKKLISYYAEFCRYPYCEAQKRAGLLIFSSIIIISLYDNNIMRLADIAFLSRNWSLKHMLPKWV